MTSHSNQATIMVTTAAGNQWQITIAAESPPELLAAVGRIDAQLYELGWLAIPREPAQDPNAPTCEQCGRRMRRSEHFIGWYCPGRIGNKADGQPIYCTFTIRS